jgi:N-acetylated-alpha-linked acidic dipeptidase
MDMPIHPGDPLTPGWGAVKGARRIAREDSDVIMKIPVLPISYGDALPMLKALGGPVAPEPWRGALPITYHIGSGPAKVHLKLSFDWSLHTLYDVIATIPGTTYPDQWVIQGNHHDGWVNGADDPISGLVAELEEARALGELLKQGWHPKRTIILCAWDGEEPALLGSTEWVETHLDELNQKAVAYLNSDSNNKGRLGMSGSHTLEHFMNEVARDIKEPNSDKSLWEAAKERQLATVGRPTRNTTGDAANAEEQRKELNSRPDLRISAMGSGSDYTPFIQHGGIASMNTGFGGEGGGGVYHSIYDSFTWYTRFGDTDFQYGRALSGYNGTLVMRMADAELLPFEFSGLADTVNKYVEDLKKLAKTQKPPQEINFQALESAAKTLTESAGRYNQAVARISPGGGLESEKLRDAKMLNETLYKSERALTSDQGLPRRPWYRHLLYAPGFYTGYGVKTIPGVREAIEEKQWSDVGPQMSRVSEALTRLASQVDRANGMLARE